MTGIKYKLKAGVLPFVLAISLVLAVVCGAAVLLTYYHHITILKDQIKEKLRANTDSGLRYALASLPELPEKEWYAFDLYGEGSDSVKIRKERWGIFDILNVEAVSGQHKYRKTALVGIQVRESKPALYLEDDNLHTFAIAGDSRISGNVYIPKAIIRAGHVEGVGYRLAQTIFGGKAYESKSSLPAPNKEMIAQLRELLKRTRANEQSLLSESSWSFSEEEPLQLHFQGRVVLRDSLVGKIILKAGKEIVVAKEAYIRDIILAAPKIVVEEDFHGQFQAFACDTVIIGRGVNLQYPSVVGVLAQGGSSYIELQEASSVGGLVFHLCKEGRRPVSLKIEKSAEVLGEVWCNGFVTHFGAVNGTLSCSQFYFTAGLGNMYHNYLYNGKIEKTELPSYFVSTPLLNTGGRRDIAKWLY